MPSGPGSSLVASPQEELPAGAVLRLGTLRFRPGPELRALAWTSEPDALVVATGAGDLFELDPESGRVGRLLVSTGDEVGGLVMAGAGTLVWFDARGRLWRTHREGSAIRDFYRDTTEIEVRCLSPSPFPDEVIAGTASGHILRIKVSRGIPRWGALCGGPLDQVLVTRGGREVVGVGASGALEWFDLRTAAPAGLRGGAIGDAEPGIWILDPHGGLEFLPGDAGGIHAFAPGPGGRRAVLRGRGDVVVLPGRGPPPPVTALEWRGGGTALVAGTPVGEEAVALPTGAPVLPVPAKGLGRPAEEHPGGRLRVVLERGAPWLRDRRQDRAIPPEELPRALRGIAPTAAAFSPRGDLLVLGTAVGGIHLLALTLGEPSEASPTSARRVGELAGHGSPITVLAVSPDGRWLASAEASGNALVWEL